MTQNNVKICITGGIGCGKSKVGDILTELGAFVLSADEINAELLSDENYLEKLFLLFPSANVNGKVNKAEIRREILRSEEKRLALNDLSHDEIFKRLVDRASGKKLAFCEVPLMTEKYLPLFDELWFVTAKDETRTERIVARDGKTVEEAREFIEVQKQNEGIKRFATRIINNDGSIADLSSEVGKLFEETLKKYQG